MEKEKKHCSHEELEKYYDGALKGGPAEDIARHIKECTECSEYLAFLKKMSSLLKENFKVSPQEGFSKKVMKKIREREARPQEKKITKGLFGDVFIFFKSEGVTAVLAASLAFILVLAVFKFSFRVPDAQAGCVVDYVYAPEGNALVYDAKDNIKVVWVFEEGVDQ